MLIHNEDFCILRLSERGRKVCILLTYLNPTSKLKLDELFHNLNHINEECLIIGDLNCRIGTYDCANHITNGQGVTYFRKSKDKHTNSRGR